MICKWLKLLSCLSVRGVTSSSPHYFTALAEPQQIPFVITLNGLYSNVLFDTGSSTSWIFTENVVPGSFKPKSHYKIQAYHEVYNYPFVGDFTATHIVQGRISLSSSVSFGMALPLVSNFPNYHAGIPNGILGGGYRSAFTRAFPTFTIIPDRNKYNIHIGHAKPHLPKQNTPCISGSLSHDIDPRLSQKWVIGNAETRLGLSIGGQAIPAVFEVDTGFPQLAIPEHFWNTVRQTIISSGASFQHSMNYQHTFTNCSPLNIPSIVYTLNRRQTIKIGSSSFAQFYGNQCILTVTVHQYVAQGLTYIGVPVLRGFITEFNAPKKTVTFCKST